MSEWYGLRPTVVRERTVPPPSDVPTPPESDVEAPPDDEPVPDE